MQLRELTEEKVELMSDMTEPELVKTILKSVAEAICFHCRDEHKGPPERSGFSYYHKYSGQSVAQCKASMIWEAPIMQIAKK